MTILKTTAVTCFCLFYFQLFFHPTLAAQRFGYSAAEQRMWKRKHQHCSGPDQSPISIHTRRSIPSNFPAMEFVFYHNLLPSPLKIHNNGHSVSLIVKKPQNFTQFPYIFGGKLKGDYEFVGLHFHWGDKNNRGAEHVINDIRYPLEMHLIHRNRKYRDLDEALLFKDGLVVLAFFYRICESDGMEIENIARHLVDLDEMNEDVELSYTFSLWSLIGNINTERFYMYRGSLTTPDCSPSVTWVVFPDPIPISLNQISRFRSLSILGIENSILVDNYRHLQPIGNRKIFLRSVATRFTRLEKIARLIAANNDRIEHDGEDELSEWYYH